MRLSARSLRWCLPALIAAGLGGCAGLRHEPLEAPPPLLLISLDGFRHDYFERAATPNLDRLIAGGLKADALVHVYPTKTFVTHYSMVTGLYAEHTGVVGNSMWDPRRRGAFSLRDRDAVADGFWYGGEPIWVTAEQQGLRAATYFWPGSEAEIGGTRPTWWMPYAHDTPHRERIDQILAWLDLPPGERPSFLALYFSHVDTVGHRSGPDSPELTAAVEAVDRDLGRLFDGLAARGLLGRMHLLVVSDHGMTGVDPQRTIFLETTWTCRGSGSRAGARRRTSGRTGCRRTRSSRRSPARIRGCACGSGRRSPLATISAITRASPMSSPRPTPAG